MKLSIWIRTGADGVVRVRTDYKYENSDTPKIQRTGNRILTALEGGDGKPTKEDIALKRAEAIKNAVSAALAIDLGNLPDLNLRNASGAVYALKPDVWQKMSCLLDCVNAVRAIQRELKQ